MILAGDIGGTHTRLAVFDGGHKVVEKKFLSRNYDGLEKIVMEFLEREKRKISKACFGVAGIVREGRCKATNLSWMIDASLLSQYFEIPHVFLLNDLVANAYGLGRLKESEFLVLQPGRLDQKGHQALISAGTGLGEAGLFWDGSQHHPFASEGGHTDFAPRNELEIELLIYLKKRMEHVSYERVISGPGLLVLYQFLIETNREEASRIVTEEMEKKDPSFVISEWGLKGEDPACVRALDWFVSLYGAEAGNLALKLLALGGIYIGGGIAPVIREHMKNGLFVSSFLDKGRFRKLLETIPIRVVLNPDTALLGAAVYAGGL